MALEIGPCQILYTDVDGSAGSLNDLGKTHGGVKLSISETYQTLHSDQSGKTPEGETITGTEVKITASLADITLENLAFITKSVVIEDGTKKKVLVTPNTGTSLMDNAKKIVIKPYEDGAPTTDANKWITLYKAGIRAAAELTYDEETQRVLAFEATGYANDDGLVACFGDDTAEE